MRKSFPILTGILVCALTAMAASPQTSTAPYVIGAASSFSPTEVVTRIAEARQILENNDAISPDSVRLAALDTATGQLTTIVLAKDEFLTKDEDIAATTDAGESVRLQIVRANGVNTAVNINAIATNEPLLPLVVQFPIVRDGRISEVAYYTSAHPALLSAPLTATGQSYIRTNLEEAAKSLAAQGESIPNDIVDVAEHLCVVEHTDHKRFMTENADELFPEIVSLYALNEGNTFRYSVSTAGAGGMIQMIPKTYEAIRQSHPNVELNPDFVSGMRDHSNALKAMLLYMNDTWKVLANSSEVQEALSSGIATKPELLAAGYNSNPARLPRYLKNGGTSWRGLIPAETQMYLAIYASVDKNLAFNNGEAATGDRSSNHPILSVETPRMFSVLSWFRASLTALFG